MDVGLVRSVAHVSQLANHTSHHGRYRAAVGGKGVADGASNLGIGKGGEVRSHEHVERVEVVVADVAKLTHKNKEVVVALTLARISLSGYSSEQSLDDAAELDALIVEVVAHLHSFILHPLILHPFILHPFILHPLILIPLLENMIEEPVIVNEEHVVLAGKE